MEPTADQIIDAHKRILPFINRTPVLINNTINELTECKVFFKCENFQKIGAFKFRGALNAIMQLPKSQAKNGVATHSSGNHAQGLALAAKINQLKAHIVMPENAPKVKVNAVRSYGAEIYFCASNIQARAEKLKEVQDNTGATMVHPFDNDHVIAGQATVGKEIFEACSLLEAIIAPVGGGGLLSGTALSAHYFSPETKVYAGEPMGANDAYKSFHAGEIIPVEKPDTIADGLLTTVSERTFRIISNHVQDIITVSDKEIIDSMKLVWERMKIIIEPSAAVPLAALFKRKEFFKGKSLAIILSGGNVDLGNLPFV